MVQDGNTALLMAALCKQVDVVKVLLEAGADKTIRNKVIPFNQPNCMLLRLKNDWICVHYSAEKRQRSTQILKKSRI
jgi:ankyrin repeat protein